MVGHLPIMNLTGYCTEKTKRLAWFGKTRTSLVYAIYATAPDRKKNS